MAGIPPTWLGSIIQTQGAQTHAAERKAKEGAAETERAGPAAFAERLQDVIESSDRDSQVYSDAEGPGSQGRPSEEEATEDQQNDNPSTPAAPVGGLDVEA
jgi:hypothetical protein